MHYVLYVLGDELVDTELQYFWEDLVLAHEETLRTRLSGIGSSVKTQHRIVMSPSSSSSSTQSTFSTLMPTGIARGVMSIPLIIACYLLVRFPRRSGNLTNYLQL